MVLVRVIIRRQNALAAAMAGETGTTQCTVSAMLGTPAVAVRNGPAQKNGQRMSATAVLLEWSTPMEHAVNRIALGSMAGQLWTLKANAVVLDTWITAECAMVTELSRTLKAIAARYSSNLWQTNHVQAWLEVLGFI